MRPRSSTLPIATVVTLLAALAMSGCTGNSTTTDSATDTGPDDGVGNMTIDPCQFDFGQMAVHSTDSTTFTISNSGTADLTVLGMTVELPFTANATVPVTVAAGSSYQFTIVFSPDTFGSFIGSLLIQSDDADTPSIECTVTGEVVPDGDADGFESSEAGGTDCDDDDPLVNPGADEIWYDGLDQDCDGLNDYDQDADGYMAAAFNPDVYSGGGDCQDVNRDIYPGAKDAWYDGVDSNCDGLNDYDFDQDGYTAAEYSGTDCDDTIPTVNPGGSEVWNGLDDDCNGFWDDGVDGNGAEITIEAAYNAEESGMALTAGDFDDNGLTELVVASPNYGSGGMSGRVSVFLNETYADGDAVDDAAVIFEDASTGALGQSLATFDFDGDNVDDLIIGAPQSNSSAGRVYVLSGGDVAGGDLAAATLTLSGWDDARLGTAVSTTDLDGDGSSDLVAYGYDQDLPYNYLAVQYGASSGDYAWADIDATWMIQCGPDPVGASPTGCGPGNSPQRGGNQHFDNNAHAPIDLDGDGYDDLIIADGYADPVNRDEGAVYVIWGRSVPFNPYLGNIEATGTTIAIGGAQDDLAGLIAAAVPDADGDGDGELYLTHEGREQIALVHGDADLRYGTLSMPTGAAATFETGNDTEAVGRISSIGDWTGDGVGDLAVALFLDTDNDNGELYLYENAPYVGDYDFDRDALVLLIGGDDGETFSTGMSVLPRDLNHDGLYDLMVGDPDGGLTEDGRAHVFYNYTGAP